MSRSNQIIEQNNKNVVSFIPEPIPNNGLAMFNAITELPQLNTATESIVEIGYVYWTPLNVGETKRCLIANIQPAFYDKVDEKGELTELELPCVHFIVNEDNTWVRMANGSKRLVATIDQAIKAGVIVAGVTPIQIKYLGKRKNSTNGFSSDHFEVKLLILNTN